MNGTMEMIVLEAIKNHADGLPKGLSAGAAGDFAYHLIEIADASEKMRNLIRNSSSENVGDLFVELACELDHLLYHFKESGLAKHVLDNLV